MTTNQEHSGGKRGRSRKADRRGQKASQARAKGPATETVSELVQELAQDMVQEPAQEIVQELVQEPVQEPVPAFETRDEDQAVQAIAATVIPEVAITEPAPMPLNGEVIPPVSPSPGMAQPVAGFEGVQAIANAYGDYTRKSFQESRSFIERLMGVRSFEEAIEAQSEFTKLACVNFVTELQKIFGLYSQLARQIFKPWGFVATITHVRRQIP